MTDYDSTIKAMHRAAVRVAYLRAKRGGILYLDDEHGTATQHFLADSVDALDLTPVNWCESACAGILARTSVPAVCDDIDNLLGATPDEYGVVWLDYMRTSVSVDVLRAALASAPMVVLTLSQRGVRRDCHVRDLERACRAAGGSVIQTATYRGRSNVRNMVTLVVERDARAPTKTIAKTSSIVGRTLRMPTALWRRKVDDARVRAGCYELRVMTEEDGYVRVAHGHARSSRLHPCEQWMLTRERAVDFLA
jgi:hypothetical protein